MSLILEALRKSEAERQRGRLPALATELPPAPAPRIPLASSWKWPLLGAAALVAAALAAWLAGAGWIRSGAAPAPPPETTIVTGPAPARAEPLPPVARFPAPPTPPRPAEPGAAAGTPVARDEARPADSPLRHMRGTPGGGPAVAAPERPPAAAPVAASTAMPHAGGAILSLADLDPETRKALPPLHVSLHLWDPDPTRRFVIVDGDRHAEGDRVGPAVLTAITPEGVLLDWNGRRIRVPLR